MPVLYEYPPTRSQRTKWVLEELEIEYESHLVNLPNGDQNQPEYRSIHPLGVLPAFQTDGYTMLESVATILQLIDENQSQGLAPAIGTKERAQYYQWCIFGCAELDIHIQTITQHEILLPEDRRDPDRAKRARALFAERGLMLSNHLSDKSYILGDQFSGADIVLGYNCYWASFSNLLQDFPVLQNYLERLSQRAAYQRAFPSM